MTDTHTISMAASELGWEDADERAKSLGFKDRSKYVQYLIEKDISHKRFKDIRFIQILLFLVIEISIIILILQVI